MADGHRGQEITASIALMADQLDSDEDATRVAAIAHLESALLSEERNKEALAAKADATCWGIEHLRAQSAYRSQQAKRLTALAQGDASRADSLEKSLVLVLTGLQPSATRLSFPNHELSYGRSQAVEIDNEDLLGPEWLTVKTAFQADKSAIMAGLKFGRQISGCNPVSRRSWRIT